MEKLNKVLVTGGTGFIGTKKTEWLGLYPLATPGWVETFLQDWAYSSAKTKKHLGYKITSFKEGIRVTLAWLRQLRKTAS